VALSYFKAALDLDRVGFALCLYSKERFDKMPAFWEPEMTRVA
jgi:hypothetical protein